MKPDKGSNVRNREWDNYTTRIAADGNKSTGLSYDRPYFDRASAGRCSFKYLVNRL